MATDNTANNTSIGDDTGDQGTRIDQVNSNDELVTWETVVLKQTAFFTKPMGILRTETSDGALESY